MSGRTITGLGPVETRILGCLLEKQRTTPDGYPLTLNSLRLACNQSTNRDPVVDYDEDAVIEGIQRLNRLELTRQASGHGSRSSKYRHLVPETLEIDQAQQALLCVLLLRGDQTPGELKQRTERLHHFEDLEAIDATLETMIDRDMVERLGRRPGEKQVRYRQLMGAGGDSELILAGSHQAATITAVLAADDAVELAEAAGYAEQLADLREQVDELRREVAALKERLDYAGLDD